MAIIDWAFWAIFLFDKFDIIIHGWKNLFIAISGNIEDSSGLHE